MKNIVKILVILFAFSLTAQAQEERNHKREIEGFSAEQQTNLMVKHLTLELDLTEKQQSQITPLIAAQVAEKKGFEAKRKAAKEMKQKPTSEERYAMKSKMLDGQIAMKKNMKTILTKEQYEKFDKMPKGRKMKHLERKKMMKKEKREKMK